VLPCAQRAGSISVLSCLDSTFRPLFQGQFPIGPAAGDSPAGGVLRGVGLIPSRAHRSIPCWPLSEHGWAPALRWSRKVSASRGTPLTRSSEARALVVSERIVAPPNSGVTARGNYQIKPMNRCRLRSPASPFLSRPSQPAAAVKALADPARRLGPALPTVLQGPRAICGCGGKNVDSPRADRGLIQRWVGRLLRAQSGPTARKFPEAGEGRI